MDEKSSHYQAHARKPWQVDSHDASDTTHPLFYFGIQNFLQILNVGHPHCKNKFSPYDNVDIP